MSAFGYHGLKEIAARDGRSLAELIALSDDVDPFMFDRPGRRLDGAQWFADLWERLAIPDGVHLRRLHYLLVSTPGIMCPSGEPYTNTHRNWKTLLSTSADARFGGLVDAAAFVDRRAAEPIVHMPEDTGSDASVSVFPPSWFSPLITFDKADSSALLDYEPTQYEFPDLPNVRLSEPKAIEPYAIELWIEKSTMNDILLPLAQRRGVGLVTGVGEFVSTGGARGFSTFPTTIRPATACRCRSPAKLSFSFGVMAMMSTFG
jgi:hypothetical protein